MTAAVIERVALIVEQLVRLAEALDRVRQIEASVDNLDLYLREQRGAA